MECLYYPYSRCMDINHLKRVILLFDKIYFLDTEPNVVRYELIRKYQHGFTLDELQRQELISIYAYLQGKKIVEIIDPSAIIKDNDALLVTNIKSDLRSTAFCKAAICHSTNTWKIMSSRLPNSFKSFFYPGSGTFSEALLLQDVIRALNTHSTMPEDSIEFYHFLRRFNHGETFSANLIEATKDVEKAEKLFMESYSNVIHGNPFIEQEAYEIPFLQASSLRINEALIVCLERGLIPITDYRIQEELLNIKVQTAFERIRDNADVLKKYDYDLPYFLPRKDLSIKIVDELLPDEVLERMSFEDIIDYKNNNQELFKQFTTKVAQLTAMIDEISYDDNYYRTIQRVFDKDVMPEIETFKRRMKESFEKDFGKIILQSTGVITPVLYASIKGGLGIKDILIACAIGELTYLSASGAETMINNISNIKNRSSSAFSYLLDLKS